MSWRLRIAIAIALGCLSTFAVAVFVALYPVEQWLGLGVRSGGGAVLRGEDHRLWQVGVETECSPLSSRGTISLWPATEQDAAAYPLMGPDALPPFLSAAARRAVDLEVLKRGDPKAGDEFTACRFGWPVPALEYDEKRNMAGVTACPLSTRTGALALVLGPVRGLRNPAAIPCIPRWWGIAEDVAAFAGVWMVLLLLPRMVRAVWWRAARRCVVCGYDRRGLGSGARCPECGGGVGRVAVVRV